MFVDGKFNLFGFSETFNLIFVLCISVAGNILWQASMSPMIIGDAQKQYVDVEELYSVDEMTVSDSDMQVGVDIFRTTDEMPAQIESNTLYRISFETEEIIESTELLYFDFYGTNYDNAAQDFQFKFDEATSEYSMMCDS